ncbi:class I SAM-dependent methyltransferase [Oleomonas cavernae]|uniref:Class I SAM-dependent methyltransferase n=1 Tax=Oleomonas cavernae TaxID=2320859 RepID=A0A418WC39_9PROT|nr:class I SAM-dependent methyltransferase [Oleomonas cavernae]RJF87572.1 class I SAM-dependent methyltransferase [Oleomonas cavernae]
MSDEPYDHPRLVALYDRLNPAAADTDFYLRLAGDTPRRILDLGCGTGLLTMALAARGHLVSGLDPATAMLEVGRRRAGGARVRWIAGDARSTTLDARFDLIIMTGHVFQVFLTDADIHAVLANARRHLGPGGRLAFDSRNPLTRPWERWTPETSRRRLADARVELEHHLLALDGDLVSFETRYRFDNGATLATTSRLRFLPQAAIAGHLAAAGFGAVDWFGDWHGATWTAGHGEIIAVARAG